MAQKIEIDLEASTDDGGVLDLVVIDVHRISVDLNGDEIVAKDTSNDLLLELSQISPKGAPLKKLMTQMKEALVEKGYEGYIYLSINFDYGDQAYIELNEGEEFPLKEEQK